MIDLFRFTRQKHTMKKPTRRLFWNIGNDWLITDCDFCHESWRLQLVRSFWSLQSQCSPCTPSRASFFSTPPGRWVLISDIDIFHIGLNLEFHEITFTDEWQSKILYYFLQEVTRGVGFWLFMTVLALLVHLTWILVPFLFHWTMEYMIVHVTTLGLVSLFIFYFICVVANYRERVKARDNDVRSKRRLI